MHARAVFDLRQPFEQPRHVERIGACRTPAQQLRLPLDGGQGVLEIMGRREQELVTRADALLELVIQPGVVDRQGSAAGQLLGQDKVGRRVATARSRQAERQPANRMLTRSQRHPHQGADTQITQELEVLRARRGCLHPSLGDLGHELCLAPQERPAGRVGAERSRWHIARHAFVLRRIGVGPGHPLDRLAIGDHVNEAEIGEGGYRQARHGLQAGLVVERGHQRGAGLGQESKTPPRCLGLAERVLQLTTGGIERVRQHTRLRRSLARHMGLCRRRERSPLAAEGGCQERQEQAHVGDAVEPGRTAKEDQHRSILRCDAQGGRRALSAGHVQFSRVPAGLGTGSQERAPRAPLGERLRKPGRR